MAEPPANVDGLDRLLETALHYAQANGPHHPGSLPRFPVPSERNTGQVEVPLAILAVDDAGRRGLYAPARVVLLAYPRGDPTGIADFPGFDPEDWPPPRLGDWPPATVRDFGRDRLQVLIARFGGLWLHLLSAWFESGHDVAAGGEANEALALLAQLDPPGMAEVYRRLSPRFWSWLAASGEEARRD